IGYHNSSLVSRAKCKSKLQGLRDLKVEADPSEVARASRPLCRGHPARVFLYSDPALAPHSTLWILCALRERDAPATAGERARVLNARGWGRDKQADPSEVARASRPLCRGHPARVFLYSDPALAPHSTPWILCALRERDAPATAGERARVLNARGWGRDKQADPSEVARASRPLCRGH